MLALSRMDRVIGRMMFLAFSIMNIKLINIGGVPMGIMCINIFFVLKAQSELIIIIHDVIASGSEILI